MYFKFFQNKKCEYFPCHNNIIEEKLNCKYCFCPIYYIDDCGGDYIILENGIKDCSNCTLPHLDEDYIINKIIGINKSFNGGAEQIGANKYEEGKNERKNNDYNI